MLAVTMDSGRRVTQEALLTQFGDDAELVVEVVTIFLEDHLKQLADIASAIRSRDGQALGHAAHTLKGSVSNFGANEARAAAQALERMGKQGTFDGVGAAHADLVREVELLTNDLKTIVAKLAA
jgi:HPt (histidine-containing phosphotransfer) domain-containing protein